MWALCAARVSLVSVGMAVASIWSLSEPSSVRCSTVTLVIFVPARVTCTCMGPYWVLATVPVTVRLAAWVVAVLAWVVPALGVPLALAAAEPVELGAACGVVADGAGALG